LVVLHEAELTAPPALLNSLYWVERLELMLVNELGPAWLSFKRQEVAAATFYTHRRLLRDAVYPRLGHRMVDSISTVELQLLLSETLDKYSENEALKLRAVLRGLFEHAHRLAIVSQNPALRTRLPKGVGTRTVRIREVPSTADARAISAALDPEYSLMPLLAGFAGLRWQEVAALRREDFSLNRREITIERALGRFDGVKAPKTPAGLRISVWADEIDDELTSMVLSRDSEWLFRSKRGAALHYSNWRRRYWLPACEAAGLAWTFHQYRHTFAVESLRRGRSVQSVAAMMGHTNPCVTWEFYAGLFDDHLEDARRAW
jgi:integrase